MLAAMREKYPNTDEVERTGYIVAVFVPTVFGQITDSQPLKGLRVCLVLPSVVGKNVLAIGSDQAD